MARSENRCANCGGKFGLVCYHHWGLRFCRKLSIELILCNGAVGAKPAQLSLAGRRSQIIVRKEMLWCSVREAHRL